MMIKEINIELFKFDAKVDYLPYYKKYTVEYSDEDTVLNLLNKINDIEKFDYEAKDGFNVKINNLYMNVRESVAKIVELTSNEFKIEPVSIFRSTDDLLIDKEDYLQKLQMFSGFVSQSDLDEYAQNLELDYYASNTYDKNRDYIGDSALLIASDIISNSPEHKDEILDMISQKDSGIWYHTSLQNRVLNYNSTKEDKIQALLSMMPKSKRVSVSNTSKTDVPRVNVSQHFDGFNIASYEGLSKDSCVDMIHDSKASYVELSLKNEDLAPHSKVVNKDFSLKIAGEILLQAKDNDADFIVVRDKDDIMLFDGMQKSIENAVGREIEMPVVSQEQFSQLLAGEKDSMKLGFNNHKVKVSFL